MLNNIPLCIFYAIIYTCIKRSHFGGRKDCLVFKSTHCFCRGPELGPQHPYQVVHNVCNSSSRALVPSSGLGEHGVHVRFPLPHAEFKNHIFFCFRNVYHFQVPIKQKKRLEFMHIVFICETTLEYVLMEQTTSCLLPLKVIVAQCFPVHTSVHLANLSSSTAQIILIFW